MKARGLHNLMQRRAVHRSPGPPLRLHAPRANRATPHWLLECQKQKARWHQRSFDQTPRSEADIRVLTEELEAIARRMSHYNRRMRRQIAIYELEEALVRIMRHEHERFGSCVSTGIVVTSSTW